VVRVGNLNELNISKVVKYGTTRFIYSNGGASLKPPWPKPSLGIKDQVRKKSTPVVTSMDAFTIHVQLK